ncbi:fumarylacetoacetate hydrolase family protein [bacterium SCSIO 12696]|nr:fumarylacetoacetate hydrolase family protein [bacterium SCSIO 12696]
MTIAAYNTVKDASLTNSLPDNCREGTWVGRAWLPASYSPTGTAGPHLITVRDKQVIELSGHLETIADLVSKDDPVSAVRNANGNTVCSLEELLENSLFHNLPEDATQADKPHLLAPNDLQAIKACGVTFAVSMLERVIEERAGGDPNKAAEIRAVIRNSIGDDLHSLVPGSEAAMALKDELIKAGMWSQYLEVGIGPDAEVFTKSQVLSAITSGAQLGVLSTSHWNNPEPEIALLVTPDARAIGATLGNDVNLRDYEGRSALLLGKAKDQNGTCCLGPLFRLFDDSFSLEDVKSAEVELTLVGEDGFRSSGANKMSQISRTPESLVAQTCNRSHQYPDGLVLFMGTMFAPTEDRGEAGLGFTHQIGDRVEISSAKLGKLVNWVNHCDRIPEWQYGLSQLVDFIANQRIAKLANKEKASL